MTMKRIEIVALLLLALSPATPAHATKYWKNSVTTGNWSTGNNWSAVSAADADSGGVPEPPRWALHSGRFVAPQRIR